MPFFNYDSKANVEVSFVVRMNGHKVAEIPVLKGVRAVDGEWLRRRVRQLHNLRASIRRN